jgi:hypothetical protein
MKTLFKITILSSLVILITYGCVQALGIDEAYKGKIIDANTEQPIEGVVVLGTWYTSHFSPAGSTHDLYDARETVTDNKGEFSIPGMGLSIMSNLEPMHVLIFKAGYEYLNVPWVSLKKDFLLKEKIKWERNKAIIPLKMLTTEERNRSDIPSRPNIPIDKMKLMTEEVNRERIERGLKPL